MAPEAHRYGTAPTNDSLDCDVAYETRRVAAALADATRPDSALALVADREAKRQRR